MGGTSTDIAVISDREAVTHRRTFNDLPLCIPMLPILTVGAGGGSIAKLDPGGMLKVGPQSAGALPGPACYGHQRGVKEWVPTVTDAHVCLGQITTIRW